MSEEIDGGPAFPVPNSVAGGKPGLSKRAYITVELLKGMLSNPILSSSFGADEYVNVVDRAIRLADKTLMRLGEKPSWQPRK